MIRFRVDFGKNSLLMDLPTDELFDHLGSIGILENIPIGGTDKLKSRDFPTMKKSRKLSVKGFFQAIKYPA